MTFTQSISTCFKKYVTFSGRARRSEFWWFFLFSFLMFWALAFLLGFFVDIEDSNPSLANTLTQWVFFAGYVALLIPYLAVTWRRLHDAGLPGPWFFISFVPFGIVALIVMLCQRTQPNENKFGPVPS